jgi:hypothetical protein
MKVIRTRNLISLGLVVILLFAFSGIAAAAPMSGAIWTSDTSGTVNRNIYNNKSDVYLNGGPAHPGAAGLPDGNYWVKVTSPNDILLGYSTTAIVVVIDGSFVQNYQLCQIVVKASNGKKGYDTTPNAGGVYKVWISQDSTFPSALSKTDNFKVKNGSNNNQGTLEIYKFYDKNANGIWDIDEVQLPGWKVNISDQFGYFEDGYTPMTTILLPGVYWVSEYMPLEPNWIPTTLSYVTTTVYRNNGVTYVLFGNVCLGPGGAYTLGYWANRGQDQIDTDDLAMLRSLNLVSENGSAFDPYSREEVRSWLLGANASNMAYMLSAQLAAMALNVYNGYVNGNSMVYAPGLLPFAPIPGLSQLGFISINNLLTAANNELGLHTVVYGTSPWRLYQDRLKSTLDSANNNLNFVSSTPCPYTFN